MKKLLPVAVAFFTFAASGLFAHLYNRTDDLSLRYILWKKGFHPRPADILPGAMLSDRNGNESVFGKTKEEIKEWFPDVHEKSINDYQRMYDKELAGRDYLWIGESDVIVVFKDGQAERLRIMKG